MLKARLKINTSQVKAPNENFDLIIIQIAYKVHIVELDTAYLCTRYRHVFETERKSG